jgi:hypothetical protein
MNRKNLNAQAQRTQSAAEKNWALTGKRGAQAVFAMLRRILLCAPW